jgi:hypothetical protein
MASLQHIVFAGFFVQSGLVQLGCERGGQFVSHVSRSPRIQSIVVRLGGTFESNRQRDGHVRSDQMYEPVRPRSCGRQLFCFGTSLLSLLSLVLVALGRERKGRRGIVTPSIAHCTSHLHSYGQHS